MSRPSRTRKKAARKPTPLNATLQTIREDDDLVAATATVTISSTLQNPNAMRSKTSTSQRHRQAKSAPTGTQVSVQVDFKAVFEALWNEIGPRTKEMVMFHLGQLLNFTDSGRDGALAWIELCFSPDRCHPESVAQATNVTLFLAILRDGPIEVLRAIKAFADKASNDCGEDRTGSDLSREKTVPSGLGGSDSNITMGGSDESTSDASMQDASILLPNQLAPKTRVSGRINRPDY